MKRLSVLAAGMLGSVGAAFAVSGVITAAPASAQTCADTTPPLTPTRVVCVINEQTGTFFMSVNPANQLNTFLNGTDSLKCTSTTGGPGAGTCTTVNDGLGILDQPTTFVNSIVGPGGFLDGPRSP
jgi:hypothetical protein